MVTVRGTFRVTYAFEVRIKFGGLVAEMEIHGVVRELAPNASESLAFPKPFGQRRAIVGSPRFGADYSDRSLGIDFANAVDGGRGRHPTPDDQVRVIVHRSSLT